MADQTLFRRLKRLFSTNVVIRNVGGKLKVTDTERIQSFSDLSTNFPRGTGMYSLYSTMNRIGYNASLNWTANRLVIFNDYELMEMDPIIACLDGDTRVCTLQGFKTIKDLSNEYPNGEPFEIWSWDKEACQYTIGQAHHPRKTGTKKVIEIYFDNNTLLKCTEDHRILLKDGTYKQAKDLKENDSVMPFMYKKKEYMMIHSKAGRYKKAHKYIYEDIFGMNINGRVIHHVNHNKYDNRTSNLQSMSIDEHAKYHGKSTVTSDKKKFGWSAEARKKQSEAVKKRFENADYKKMFSSLMVTVRADKVLRKIASIASKKPWGNKDYREKALLGIKGWQQSDEGKKFMSDHASEMNTERWNTDTAYRNRMIKIFSSHAKSLWQTPGFKEKFVKARIENLRLKIANDSDYTKKTYGMLADKNSNFDHEITNESILLEGIKYPTIREFAENFDLKKEFSNTHVKMQFISRRLKQCGYKDFNDYKLTYKYENHKVVKIVDRNEIVDVYDLTVDHFENFCLENGTIVSNSALDIYSDESTVKNEFGDVLTIKSDNAKVRDLLHNLFYDVLNIEFNIWPWIRNMCKYGDAFLKLEISEKYGIVNVIPLSSYELTREDGYDKEHPTLVRFKQLTGQSENQYLENYEIAHFRLLSDTNWLPYGKCLSPNTKIDTEFACKDIKDIEIGDKVWTFNTEKNLFELSSVLKKVCSGNKELIRISTQHNFIDTSKNHPILVIDNETKKYSYKIAESIKVGDLLVIRSYSDKKHKKIQINKSLPDGNHLNWKKQLKVIPNCVDEQFARFFGFMVGDGWLTESDEYSYAVKFALSEYEDLNTYYLDLLEKYSGKKPSICKKSKTAVLYSKLLFCILKNNGFGHGAKYKRIPLWVFESSKSVQRAFIQGLTDADGWETEDEWCNTYGITLCNKQLILDFKKLVQMNDIKSSIPKHKIYNDIIEICGKKCNRSEAHSFTYYLDADEKQQIEKYKVFDTSDFLTEPVRKIEAIDEEETWDIQVDSEFSNFVANGIVAHNSMIESGRRIWKQLTLMEDAMLIHRIMRAPEKRVFKIDVGAVPPNEVETFMGNIINKIKKAPFVDPRTGEYNLKFNMMNMTEDFYVPVRGGDSGTSIDTLNGLQFNAIEDIEYLRNKMMAALKVPKSFLGYEEGLAGKATLAAEDVRFARTIERLQRIFISELTKIAIVHLYVQGVKDEELTDFSLQLTNPSTILEQEKISLWQEKTNLIRDIRETKMISADWIYKNIMNFTEDQIVEQVKGTVDDAKLTFRLSQIEGEGNDPFKTNQTFGTAHDLALLQQNAGEPGKLPQKNLNFGDTNFTHQYSEDPATRNLVDPRFEHVPEAPLRVSYGQDSHTRGRDILGSHEYSVSHTHQESIDAGRAEAKKTIADLMISRLGLSKIKTKEVITESLKTDADVKRETENGNGKDNFMDEKNILDI